MKMGLNNISQRAILFAGLVCTCSTTNPVVYIPPVVFRGIINDDSVYLPGNQYYPNTCEITDSCVRMYLRSENFSQSSISSGDLLRIDIYSADTMIITERRALLHMVRYDAGSISLSYYITPADSQNDYNNLNMRVETFEWQHGGTVALSEIAATARPLGQLGGADLEIKRGTIEGAIE
jgi:hypothetical protein